MKEHILAESSILAALFLFLVLDVPFADQVGNCRTCVRTLSSFVDTRDREELSLMIFRATLASSGLGVKRDTMWARTRDARAE